MLLRGHFYHFFLILELMVFNRNYKIYIRYIKHKTKKFINNELIVPIISDATVISINSGGHIDLKQTLISHSEYYFLTFLLLHLLRYFKKKHTKN